MTQNNLELDLGQETPAPTPKTRTLKIVQNKTDPVPNGADPISPEMERDLRSMVPGPKPAGETQPASKVSVSPHTPEQPTSVPAAPQSRLKLLNVRQAAEYLSMSKSTLDKWRSEKKQPTYLKIGRYIKYDVATLDAFLLACIRAGTD